MMYTVFPVPIFTGFLAHCDYHVAALTLAYRFVVMPPGDATEGQTTAFPAQKSPVTFPQCSFFPAPLNASCDSLLCPPLSGAMGFLSRTIAVNPIKLHTMKLKYSLDQMQVVLIYLTKQFNRISHVLARHSLLCCLLTDTVTNYSSCV